MKHEITQKIDGLISKELLTESEVNHILSLVRKYLEHLNEDDRKTYSLLNFFCDWSQHIAIDRSIPAMKILNRLNDTVVRFQGLTDLNRFNNEITQVISFLSFKEQLRSLFTSMGLSTEVIENNKKWENFLRGYIDIVLNCPLVLPAKINKKIRPYYEAITSNPIKSGMWVTGFSITRPDKSIFAGTKVSSHSKFLALVISTSDTTRFVIPLTPEKILGWKLVGQNAFPYIS